MVPRTAVATATLLTFACSPPARPRDLTMRAACVGPPATPVELRLRSGSRVFIDAATVSVGRGRLLALGSRVLTEARGKAIDVTTGAGRAVGLLVSADGRADPVSPPPGDSAVPAARALFEPGEGWHVVWLRTMPGPQSGLRPGVVMYARFDGSAWSQPIALSGRDEQFYVNPDLPGRLVRTPTGLAVAVPIRPVSGDVGILLYVGGKGRWRERRVAGTRGALYASLAAVGERLVLAYTGVNGADVGLFVRRSQDGGASWSAPTMIASGDAYDPKLVHVGDALALAWIGSESFLRPRGVRIAYSRDAGATWGEPAGTPGGADARSLATAQLDRAALLLQYDPESSPPPQRLVLVKADSVAVVDSSVGAPIQPLGAPEGGSAGDVVVLSAVFGAGDTTPVSTITHLRVACGRAD